MSLGPNIDCLDSKMVLHRMSCGGFAFEKLWDGGEIGLVEFVAV